jgi:CRP/FNR family transcriptional regulator
MGEGEDRSDSRLLLPGRAGEGIDGRGEALMRESNGEVLRRVRIFARLDEGGLRMLAERSRRRQYRAGEHLFHEGDPGQTLYVIVSGRVRMETITASGQRVYIAERGPGETFGELALFDGKPRMADAVTTGTADLLLLDRSEFLQCLERSPQTALAVMACLADRLREAGRQLEEVISCDVLGRVSAALLELSATRAGLLSDEAVGGPIKITQEELATRVSARRETVSRALAKLEQVEAIRYDRHGLEVIDAARLRRYYEQ